MRGTHLLTLSHEFQKVRVTNATDNGFPSRVPTATEPTGTGNSAAQATASSVFTIANSNGILAPNIAIIVPFGAGSDTNTMSMRVIGWRTCGSNNPTTMLWVPVMLIEAACTLSTPTGVGSRILASTDRIADTIAQTYPSAPVAGVEIGSNGANVGAYFKVDLSGFRKVEFTFTTGGSATNCNALAAWY